MKDPFHFDDIPVNEDKLSRTIALSKAAFLECEAGESVSYMEFLYQQSRYIKKRWWLVQGLLLAFLCCALHSMDSDPLIRRSLGITAPLFVTLILPELWKNRSSDAMEIEGTTFYSLRQIYAARLTLFAGMDALLLTLFFMGASFAAKLTFWDMVIHFLLPFNVTCCICFRCFYSKKMVTEAGSMLLCCFWIALWTLVILSDAVYYRITVPMWAGLLSASVLYMGYAVCRGQKQNTLEVKTQWN